MSVLLKLKAPNRLYFSHDKNHIELHVSTYPSVIIYLIPCAVFFLNLVHFFLVT